MMQIPRALVSEPMRRKVRITVITIEAGVLHVLPCGECIDTHHLRCCSDISFIHVWSGLRVLWVWILMMGMLGLAKVLLNKGSDANIELFE